MLVPEVPVPSLFWISAYTDTPPPSDLETLASVCVEAFTVLAHRLCNQCICCVSIKDPENAAAIVEESVDSSVLS